MSPAAMQIEHMSGLQKAAILLLLLGDDAASSVYKNLPDEELQRLAPFEAADLGLHMAH